MIGVGRIVRAFFGLPEIEYPTAPGDLQVTPLADTGVTLTWTPSTSGSGYQVLIDGYVNQTLLGRTQSTTVVSGLEPGTDYVFSVRSFDTSGNFSPESNTISYGVPEEIEPPTPTPIYAVPPLPKFVPPVWNWAVGPWKGNPERELASLSGRKMTVKLDDPSDASFSLMGDSPESALVNELIEDLWIYRNGKKLYRGRVTSSSDSLGDTSYSVNFNTADYRDMLRRRVIITSNNNLPLFYTGIISVLSKVFVTGTPLETIIWDLITHAQQQPGMDLGITKGLWPVTGRVNAGTDPYEYGDGEDIWGHIVRITDILPGLDFWVDADRKANISTNRGSDHGAVLDYGGVVTAVQRSFDQSAYANFVRQSGQQPSQPYSYAPPNIALREEGGWATAIGDPDLKNPTQIQNAGKANFDRMSRSLPTDGGTGQFSYRCTMAAGAWQGPDHIWVGDTVRLRIKRGRLDINQLMRVYELSISIDENNVETVEITLNWPNNPRDNIKRFVASVQNLNRQ